MGIVWLARVHGIPSSTWSPVFELQDETNCAGVLLSGAQFWQSHLAGSCTADELLAGIGVTAAGVRRWGPGQSGHAPVQIEGPARMGWLIGRVLFAVPPHDDTV